MNKTILDGPEYQPASGENPKQLIIFLHGYGSNGADLISLAPEFSSRLPDAHFLSPNAPTSCEMAPNMSGAYQWFSLFSHEAGVMYDGACGVSQVLDDFIDEQLQRFGLDDSALSLIGFSQGTMMSLHVALRRDKQCAGILGYSGMLLNAEPIDSQIKSKPPVCLVHGVIDPVVPFISMNVAQTALLECGVNVETHSRPMLPHGIDPEGISIGKKFLQRIYGV